jgi:hypothetical protein
MQTATILDHAPAHLLQAVLMWLAIGIAMLLSFNASDWLDAFRRFQIRKRGRLPSVPLEVIAIAVAIVLWPKLARRVF